MWNTRVSRRHPGCPAVTQPGTIPVASPRSLLAREEVPVVASVTVPPDISFAFPSPSIICQAHDERTFLSHLVLQQSCGTSCGAPARLLSEQIEQSPLQVCVHLLQPPTIHGALCKGIRASMCILPHHLGRCGGPRGIEGEGCHPEQLLRPCERHAFLLFSWQMVSGT